MKYCGPTNEMRPVRHNVALQACLGTGVCPAFIDSVCHPMASYFTVLFLNPLRTDGFLQGWYLLCPFAMDHPFNLLMGIM